MSSSDVPLVTKVASLDMQVCVPVGWTDEKVKAFADAENSAGTELGWVITRAGDRVLLGDPERNPCAKREGFVHVMLHC